MKRIVMVLFTVMAIGTMARGATLGTDISSTMLFAYDKSMPLAEDMKLIEDKPQLLKYHVTFASTNGERVTALYYVPKNAQGPMPAVIALHGAAGSKEDIIIAYEFFAMRGFAVLAIDAALHGERKAPGINALQTDWFTLRHIYQQTVVDLERSMDWLETRLEVDKTRIGFFGASMGTIIGTTFCGLDQRVAAAALIIGGADFHVLMRHSQLPGIVIMRNFATEQQLDAVADDLAPVDPQYYVGAIAPRPALYMNGRQDYVISPEAGARLQELAGEPKETYWYDGGHIPPIDQVMLRSANFFKKHLKKKKEESPQEDIGPPMAPMPEITFSLKRDFVDPVHRIVVITAKAAKPLPEGAFLALYFPELPPRNLALFDDGTHGDAKAGDGAWSFRFELGPHPVDLDAVGGAALYAMKIRAVGTAGEVLSEVDAGILTGEQVTGAASGH